MPPKAQLQIALGAKYVTPPTQIPSWVYVLFGWVGGIAATVVGSYITNRIRIYQDELKSHRDELKDRVLIPLHAGMDEHFRPLIFNQRPTVTVGMGMVTHFDVEAKAGEEQIEQGDVLFAPFPSGALYGPLDRVLLEDAKKNHFPAEMAELDGFVKKWAEYSAECYSWVLKIAQEILVRSGLAAFPPRNAGPGFQPHVTHFRLAVFVYKRLFQQSAPALRVEQMGTDWTIQGECCTAALRSKEQMVGLVAQIDKLRDAEKATAQMLLAKLGELQREFQKLMPKLEYSIAARRVHGGCDLVTLLWSV